MLHLFGTPYLEHAGRRLELTSNKPTLLLLYLAYNGEWLSRDALATLFQPEADEASAKHTLRVMIGRAKAFAWAETLEIEHTRLRFNINTDVRSFREAVGKADWQNAVTLHRRPLLENFAVRDAPGFEAWLELERDNLLNAWREACTNYANALEKAGNHSEAATVLQRPLELEPLAEDVVQTLARNLYLAGKRDAALETLTQFSNMLRKELGLDPMQETLNLLETVRRAETLTTKTSRGAKRQVPLEVLRPPQFIGREHELGTLRDTQRVVLIAGEPGVGKTRLLVEALPEARWLYCREGLGKLPYHPLVEYLKQKRELLPDIGVYRDEVARLVPELAPHHHIGSVDPEMSKVRLLEALARVLEAEATPIAVDDLQWADAATLEFLVFLYSRGKVQLAGTYRSSEDTAQLKTTRTSLRALVLKLEPFAEIDIQQLMGGLTGLERGPEAFSQWLYERSGGNVFFALETLRYLFEQNALEVRGGNWRTALDSITRDYHELALPPKISEIMARRLSQLSEAAQRTLQAASVLRQGFDAKLLSNVIGLSELATLDALEEAEGTSLLKLSEGRYRFSHDLMRQSLYNSLSKMRRNLLHARFAETLQSSDTALAAEHWLEAGETHKAFPLFLETAETYRQRGLLEESLAVLDRALEHAPTTRDALELQCRLAWLELTLNHHDKASERLEHVLGQTSDPHVLAKALAVRAELLLYQGQIAEAERTYEASRQAFEQAGLRVEASHLKLGAEIAYHDGRLEEARLLIEKAIAEHKAEPRQHSGELVQLLSSLGAVHDALGQYEVALGLFKEALELARSIGSKYAEVNVVMNLLWCLEAQGRLEESVTIGEAALALGEFSVTSTLRNNLAWALATLKRYDEARHHYEINTRDKDPTLRCIAWSRLTHIYQTLGETEQRDQALAQALTLLEQTEFLVAHATTGVATLEYGTDVQVARVRPLLEGKGRLEPDLQKSLEAALTKRFGSPAWPARDAAVTLGE
jgi:DNA-binding SARP family transcriptional activator/Tfp pilus assembly protein PilF